MLGKSDGYMNMALRPNKLRYCLEHHLPSLGTRIESPWAYMTEIAASSGFFDYIEFEGEYTPYVESDVENICRAAELYGCATVVKVDRQNRAFLAQKAIACGASGILFADMYTAEEVRNTLKYITTSYPGGGIFGRPNRRLCMNGTGRMKMSDYRKMTDDVVKMVMIEKVAAFNDLENICKVPGVDMVVYGPFDYAVNAGWEMDINAQELEDIHKKIIDVSLHNGVQPCVLLDNASKVKYYYDMGVRHFNLGDEMQIHINYYNKECPCALSILKK